MDDAGVGRDDADSRRRSVPSEECVPLAVSLELTFGVDRE